MVDKGWTVVTVLDDLRQAIEDSQLFGPTLLAWQASDRRELLQLKERTNLAEFRRVGEDGNLGRPSRQGRDRHGRLSPAPDFHGKVASQATHLINRMGVKLEFRFVE